MELDYTDLVAEMQRKFDQIEGMLNGLLYEEQQPIELLDDETILSTVQNMVMEARILEEAQKVKSINHKTLSISSKIQDYQQEFSNLNELSSKAQIEYQHIQTLQVRTVLDNIQAHKNEIISKTLIEMAKLVQKLTTVSRNDINEMFSISLIKNIKDQIHVFIQEFH